MRVDSDVTQNCRRRRAGRFYRRRRGATLIYSTIAMVVLLGISALAVDYAHIQLIKTELQRTADATARGYMEYYRDFGSSYAVTAGPTIYTATNNTTTGATPTVVAEWGGWNSSSKTFGNAASGTTAVRVTVSRTVTNGNPVRLVWASVFGTPEASITCQAVATIVGGESVSASVSSRANPYLAGMPSGSSSLGYDTLSNAAPYEVSSIPVTPGTYITLTSVSGSTTVLPGYVSYAGPEGVSSIPVHHGQNFDYSIDMSGPENGIADAIMPESAVMGLFLTNSAPNTTATPSSVIDWTNPSVANKTYYTNLAVKEPFLIGDGKTSGGVTQRFMVPEGATRLFIGIWDGIAYFNNAGSFSATVNVDKQVVLVK